MLTRLGGVSGVQVFKGLREGRALGESCVVLGLLISVMCAL